MRNYKDIVPDYNEYVKLQNTEFMSFEGESEHVRAAMKRTYGYFTQHIGKTSQILDAACGDGLSLQILKELGFDHLTGFENNPLKVDKAVEKKCGLVYEGDIHNMLHLKDQSFDVIISSHTLEHAYSPSKAVQEFHRILGRGGALFVIIPFPDHGNELAHGGKYELRTDTGSIEKVEEFFIQQGFDVIESRMDSFREPELWLSMVRKDN